MKTSPHIVKMEPYLVEKVWGGRRLTTLFGKEITDDKRYGESWEIADLDEGQSLVASGPLAGLPLRALAEGWKRSLVGHRADRADRFPLLVKLLDATQDLSVQVHPGPDDVAGFEGAQSKQETWLILDADDDGEIIHGLAENGLSPRDFRDAIDAGVVEEILQRVQVSAGDVIDVNPGTIHAICSGVALLEIQEPSDTTYRVYDYERPGLDGQLRQLHLEEAMKVAHLRRSDQIIGLPASTGGPVELVAQNRAYRIEKLEVEEPGRLRWHIDPDSPQILHVLKGRIVVEDGIGGEVELGSYESAVVPAVLGSVRAEVIEPCSVMVAGLAVEELVRGLRVGAVSDVDAVT